mgnify:CR=1 FL=1
MNSSIVPFNKLAVLPNFARDLHGAYITTGHIQNYLSKIDSISKGLLKIERNTNGVQYLRGYPTQIESAIITDHYADITKDEALPRPLLFTMHLLVSSNLDENGTPSIITVTTTAESPEFAISGGSKKSI